MLSLRIVETSSYRKNPAYDRVAMVSVLIFTRSVSSQSFLTMRFKLRGDLGSILSVAFDSNRLAVAIRYFTVVEAHGLGRFSTSCNHFKAWKTVCTLPYVLCNCVHSVIKRATWRLVAGRTGISRCCVAHLFHVRPPWAYVRNVLGAIDCESNFGISVARLWRYRFMVVGIANSVASTRI